MRLFFWKSTPKASPKRLVELEEEIGDVKMALAWCKKAIVDLNARMATVSRLSREKSSQDDAGAPIEEKEVPRIPSSAGRPAPTSFPTAHLARRFRGF